MPTSISDPKLTFKNLIKDNWVPANVLTITPAFHTGFLNPAGDQYQVVFPSAAESTIAASGYDAMSPEGPVSRRVGTVPIMIFGKRAATGSAGAINPKKFLDAARKEVERLIHANVTSITDMEYVSVINSAEVFPDVKENEPTFYGWTVIIQYVWRRTIS